MQCFFSTLCLARMLLFSQRKSEERGYNYRSNTSSGSSRSSRDPGSCPLPGYTLDVSPLPLSLGQLFTAVPISLLSLVSLPSLSRDKKGKLELKAKELKIVMRGQACLLEIIQMEKKGKEKKPISGHWPF